MKKKSTSQNLNENYSKNDLILQDFFPYLARLFYLGVSNSVSKIYTEEYNLSVSEWRVMTILGQKKSLTAMHIVEQSSMDKVSVSRAVKRMETTKLLEKEKNATDGRSSFLLLSQKGRSIYTQLVPKVLDIERELLNGLSGVEVAQLRLLMEKVQTNASRINNAN